MDRPFTLPLDDDGIVLAVAGGKGASLGILARAGLPVPAAFIVTTHAYQRFSATGEMQRWAARAAAGVPAADSASLDAVSSTIRRRFAEAPISDAVGAA